MAQTSSLEKYYEEKKQEVFDQYGSRPPLTVRLALKGLEAEVKELRKLRKKAEDNPEDKKAQDKYQIFLSGIETELQEAQS